MLRSDEADPEGDPLVYTTSDGRRMQRWKVGQRQYVERSVRHADGSPVRDRPLIAKRIDRDEARRRYEAGESLPAIARALDCNSGQLSRALRQMGVAMRKPSDYAATIDTEDVVRRYENREGYRAIARDLGVSEQRVKEVLIDAGVLMRGVGRIHGKGRNGGAVTYQTEFDAAKPLVRERSKGVCEAAVSPNCSARGTHVHHRRMRSQGGRNDLDNLLDVCLWCHSWIHANPAKSYEFGLLLHAATTEGDQHG